MGRHHAPGAPLRRFLAIVFGGLLVLGAGALASRPAGPAVALAGSGGPQSLGGFEVDGDFRAHTNGLNGVDWADAAGSGPGLVSGPAIADPLGHADGTNFAQGAKESQDPDTWQAQAGTAPPKADIGNVFEADRTFGGHRWAYFGFERVSSDGTVYDDIELDQQPNHQNPHGLSVPSRSAGDVLFVVRQRGDGSFLFDATYQTWSCPQASQCDATGAWSTPTAAAAAFFGLANETAIPQGPWSDAIAAKGMVAADAFAEMAIDLTALGLVPGCPSGGFGTLNVRSVASDAQDGQTPELKDFASAPVSIPSSCLVPSTPTPTPTRSPTPAPKHTPKPSLPNTGGSPTPGASGAGGNPSPNHSLPATTTAADGSSGPLGGGPLLPLILLGLGGLTMAASRLRPEVSHKP